MTNLNKGGIKLNTVQVLQRLQAETSAEVYIVGGFVRDLLRNKNNTDLDIVVRNLSLKDIKSFLANYGKVKEVKIAKTSDHFSVSILLFRASKHDFEAQISLPRRGKNQIPYSHNTLRQDVKFRDFKINSLYLPINYKSRKDVIDLVGGREDIVNRIISSNGSASERIKESPIRMMRAISLASRTNYTLAEDLIGAIYENASLINNCPAEAIRNEFNKILMSKKPSKYLRILQKTGLLKHIAPELEKCVGIRQDRRYHKFDVFNHSVYTCDNCAPDLVLRLAGLLHDIGKAVTRREVPNGGDGRKVTFHKHEMASVKMARDLLRRLRYDTNTTKAVLILVKLHMFHYTRDWTDAAVRKFIKKAEITEEYMDEKKISEFPLFKLRAAERKGNGLKCVPITDRQTDFEKRIIQIYKESHTLDVKDLEVNGNTIMEVFKLKPGVQVGNILNFLLEKVLESPHLNNKLDLLKLTTEYLHGPIVNRQVRHQETRQQNVG
jgi:poly(A) polymerase/tRNA nucleotidyltransferase (CCA-adding enzyme)